MKLPDPLAIDWQTREVSTATSFYRRRADGRVEVGIDHAPLTGVTPEMLVWWFENFPVTQSGPGTMVFNGERVLMYRLWHPRDHIRVEVTKPAPGGGKGLSKGARASINERIGERTVTLSARIAAMSEDGICLQMMAGPLPLAELRHSFSPVPEGTLHRSRLIVGPNIPFLGGLLGRRRFNPERAGEWIKHNVEEAATSHISSRGSIHRDPSAPSPDTSAALRVRTVATRWVEPSRRHGREILRGSFAPMACSLPRRTGSLVTKTPTARSTQ